MKNILKRFLLISILLASAISGNTQTKIQDLPTLTGDPSGGWLWISKDGISKKVDAAGLGSAAANNVYNLLGQTRMSAYFNDSTATTYRTDNLLYALTDDYTGENVVFWKVTDTAGIKIDSVVYCKKAGTGEVFRRVLTNNVLNPEWYGLVGDGLTDNGQKAVTMSSKIKAYGPGYTLLVPAKTFLCNTPFSMPDNFTLLGADKWKSIIKNMAVNNMAAPLPIIGFGNVNNITVKNIRFEGINNSRTALAGRVATNFTVDNCTSNCPLFGCTSLSSVYSTTTPATINRNIQLTNNICIGTGDISQPGSGLYLGYVDGATVFNNTITHFNQGVHFWGGDAGVVAEGVNNTKWAKNLTFSQNRVNDIYGGGIWGSKGEHIAIGTNITWDCYDVCIDLEGCNEGTISNNEVTNGKNGGITTFFACRSINISNNTVRSNQNNSYLIQIYNAYQTTDNKDISIINNTLSHTGTGFSYVGGDNTRDFVLAGNTMTDVKVDANANNFNSVEIKSNTMLYYHLLNDSSAAVSVGGYHTNGRAYVSSNTIKSFIAQPTGVMGIYIKDDDYNTSNKVWIRSNITDGFTRDIVVHAASANADVYPEFYIDGNVLGNAKFERVEKLGRSRVILSNNKDALGRPFPLSVPTSGKWDVGQKVEFAVPDTAKNTGAVCIIQGTPGTWKLLGAGGSSLTSAQQSNIDAVPGIRDSVIKSYTRLTDSSGKLTSSRGDTITIALKDWRKFILKTYQDSINALSRSNIQTNPAGIQPIILLADSGFKAKSFFPGYGIKIDSTADSIKFRVDTALIKGGGSGSGTISSISIGIDNAAVDNDNDVEGGTVTSGAANFIIHQPDASLTARGLVNILAQGFNGYKYYNGDLGTASFNSEANFWARGGRGLSTTAFTRTGQLWAGALGTYPRVSIGGAINGTLVDQNNAQTLLVQSSPNTMPSTGTVPALSGLDIIAPTVVKGSGNSVITWPQTIHAGKPIVLPSGVTSPNGSYSFRADDSASIGNTIRIKNPVIPITDSSDAVPTFVQLKQLLQNAVGAGAAKDVLSGATSNNNITAATSEYVGAFTGITTVPAHGWVKVGKAGTINSVFITYTTYGGSGGDAGVLVSFYLRVTTPGGSLTEYLIANSAVSATDVDISNTAMNGGAGIAVVPGSKVEMRVTYPTMTAYPQGRRISWKALVE